MAKKNAFIISFEGIEGTGKSTQCRLLRAHLKRKGLRVALFREPGSSTIGEEIRRILLHGKGKLTPFSETLLFIAARGQLVAEKILPSLRAYEVIIVDRYIDATHAYQGYGAGVDQGLIKTLNMSAVGKVVPDCTFLLDAAPRVGLARSGRTDRFEKRTFLFFEKVRRGYLFLARKNRERITVISAIDSIARVHARIQEIVDSAYRRRGK